MRPVWLLLAGCVACGTGGETCLEMRVRYTGSATGQVIVKDQFTDAQGTPTGSGALVFPQGQSRPPWVVGGPRVCFGRGGGSQESVAAVAWIDVNLHYPDYCRTGVCEPQPGDPIGQATMRIEQGELNQLEITIRDP